MSATLPRGELRGAVDGALAHEGLGAEVTAPYLLIVEAKRGVENQDPVAQLIGGLVCAAFQNQRDHARDEQHLAGAYTVSDLWTFVEAWVTALDSDQPKVRVVFSREYTEKTGGGGDPVHPQGAGGGDALTERGDVAGWIGTETASTRSVPGDARSVQGSRAPKRNRRGTESFSPPGRVHRAGRPDRPLYPRRSP